MLNVLLLTPMNSSSISGWEGIVSTDAAAKEIEMGFLLAGGNLTEFERIPAPSVSSGGRRVMAVVKFRETIIYLFVIVGRGESTQPVGVLCCVFE